MSATLERRRRGDGVARRRATARGRRHFRIRKRIHGTANTPRLVVTRSLRHIVAQVVDDTRGHTLASASTMDPSLRGTSGTKSELAAKVGALVAERAKAAGVTRVVFDRGGHTYGGRVAVLADAARESGLEL